MDHREGPTACDIMVILLLDGKTNQKGNTQYMGAMRNKAWDVCPIGAMAMWLFYRSVTLRETHRRVLSPPDIQMRVEQIPTEWRDVRPSYGEFPTNG